MPSQRGHLPGSASLLYVIVGGDISPLQPEDMWHRRQFCGDVMTVIKAFGENIQLQDYDWVWRKFCAARLRVTLCFRRTKKDVA